MKAHQAEFPLVGHCLPPFWLRTLKTAGGRWPLSIPAGFLQNYLYTTHAQEDTRPHPRTQSARSIQEPDPSQGPAQQATERAQEARQQDPFVRSGLRRAVFGPKATTWAGRWCVVSGCCEQRRGSG